MSCRHLRPGLHCCQPGGARGQLHQGQQAAAGGDGAAADQAVQGGQRSRQGHHPVDSQHGALRTGAAHERVLVQLLGAATAFVCSYCTSATWLVSQWPADLSRVSWRSREQGLRRLQQLTSHLQSAAAGCSTCCMLRGSNNADLLPLLWALVLCRCRLLRA